MSKRPKFVITLLIAIVFVFSMRTENVQAKSNSEYKYYVSDGGIILTQYIGSNLHVDIPSKIDGKLVVTVDSECFNKSKVKTVYIPDSVKEVNANAFNECNSLTGVIIGNGVEKVPSAIFNECKNLKYIIFGDSLKAAVKPMSSYGNVGNLKYVSINNPDFILYRDSYNYGTIPWTYDNTYGDYEICCESSTTTYDTFHPLGFPVETKDYAEITFVDGDKTLFTASKVKKGTKLTDLYALEDKAEKGFSGWYTSSNELIDKTESSDLTVYSNFATPLKAPVVNVTKKSDAEYMLTWNKMNGYYYQIEVRYATYIGNTDYKVLKSYTKDISSYTAKVNKNYDCFFRVKCYKEENGTKIYSDYSKDAYSSKPVYPAVYVLDYYLDLMDYNGIDNSITFCNNSNKTIKSIVFTITAYDKNGEKAHDEITNDTTFYIEDPESLKTGKIRSSYWKAVWFKGSTRYAKITEAEITYTDGTTKIVKLNIKGEFVEKEILGY
jgi:hypothetical protein